jgi:hypothetical protein
MLTMQDIQTRIAPVTDDIASGFVAGWDTWLKMVNDHPEFTRPFGPTVRANIVHAHACQEINERVSARGYGFNTALGFKALAVGNDLLLRFKYQRDGGPPSNVRTFQQRELARQRYTDKGMATLALEGFSDPPEFVTVGYILNVNGTKISRIVVRRDCRGYLPLQFDIYPAAIATFVEPLLLPNIEEPTPAKIRSPRPDVQEITGEDV